MMRNRNLFVRSKKGKDWIGNEFFVKTSHPCIAKNLDLNVFIKAEEMTFWEQCAYNCYGHKECEKEGINTLADLFGKKFSDKFFTRKNYLIAIEYLKEAEEDLKRAQKRVKFWRNRIKNPTPKLRYPNY